MPLEAPVISAVSRRLLGFSEPAYAGMTMDVSSGTMIAITPNPPTRGKTMNLKVIVNTLLHCNMVEYES
jgi:hypothetical protein